MDWKLSPDETPPDGIAHWVRHNQGSVWADVLGEAEVVARIHATSPGLANYSMHQTQIAYVMRCFAIVDGLSQFVWGGSSFDGRYGAWKNARIERAKEKSKPAPELPSPQVWRMMAFLNRYMGVKRTAARLAVDLYRHTPMHEGFPHALLDAQNRLYMWELGWEATAGHHFHIRPQWTDAELREKHGSFEPNEYFILEIGTLTLIREVAAAIDKYGDDMQRVEKLYRNYLKLDAERWKDKLRWTPLLSSPHRPTTTGD